MISIAVCAQSLVHFSVECWEMAVHLLCVDHLLQSHPAYPLLSLALFVETKEINGFACPLQACQ